jgi:hypothetical protein
MRQHVPVLATLPLVLVMGGLGPAHAHAQDRSVSWVETREFEVPGPLGGMMARAAGQDRSVESRRAIHLLGRTLREDDGSSSVLVDLDGGRYLLVDHEEQTYLVFTFQEAAEAARDFAGLMAAMTEDLDEVMDEARAEYEEAMAELQEAMDEAELEVDVSFDVQHRATGQTRSFNGLRAQRHVITARLEVRSTVEGLEDAPEGGTMVFLSELWQSDEVPTLDEVYEEWGRQMAEDPEVQAIARELAASMETQGGGAGTDAIGLWDPRIAAGLEELSRAMEALDGTTIRSATTVAVVPDGAPYDEGELLGWEPTSTGTYLRRAAGEAVAEAGRAQARRAIRGATRGVLGRRGGNEPEEEEEEEAQVRPLFRMISEKRDLEVGTPTAPLDLDIQGYREVTLAELMEAARPPEG